MQAIETRNRIRFSFSKYLCNLQSGIMTAYTANLPQGNFYWRICFREKQKKRKSPIENLVRFEN
jgi:hypothetical protein